MLAAHRGATILRPSIVFGPEDDFFNRFAALARLAPVLPLTGGGHTRFQPVFAGDVAEAIAKAVDGETKPGTIYELGGPDVLTFKELMEFVLATIERRRLLVPVPFAMDEAAGGVSAIPAEAAAHARPGRAPQNTTTWSRAAAQEQGRTLEGLGIVPNSVGVDRARLSLAVPQGRPIPRPHCVMAARPSERQSIRYEPICRFKFRRSFLERSSRDHASYLNESATRVRKAVTFPLSTLMSILVTSATRRSRKELEAVATAMRPASSHDFSLTPTTSIIR